MVERHHTPGRSENPVTHLQQQRPDGGPWAPHPYRHQAGDPYHGQHTGSGSIPTQQGPPPQWSPPPAPPKKPRFGLGARLAMIVGGVLVLGLMVSNNDDDRAIPAGSTGATRPAVAGAVAPPAGQQQAPAFLGATSDDVAIAAGETLQADGLRLSASPLVPGDDTFGATLCTTVTYANDGTGPARFGAFDWSLQNPNGADRGTDVLRRRGRLPRHR